jgi:hypothetical protein
MKEKSINGIGSFCKDTILKTLQDIKRIFLCIIHYDKIKGIYLSDRFQYEQIDLEFSVPIKSKENVQIFQGFDQILTNDEDINSIYFFKWESHKMLVGYIEGAES